MRQLRTRLVEIVKGMGFVTLLIVGIPLVLLYLAYWLLSRTLLMIGMLVALTTPFALAYWGWANNRWLGAFIVACYAIAFLVWKKVGDDVKSAWYARGWWVTRGYKNRRYLAQYAPKHR